MDLSVRRDEEEEEGSEKCPVNNGTVTPGEEVVVEQEEQGATTQSREGEGEEKEGAGAVIDLSAAVPASNKRLREGDEASETSGDCEAPPASRPRLATTPEANNTANHVENHQTPSDDTPKVNGMSNGYESDSNGTNDVNDNEVEEEMPPIPPMKELTPEELAEKMKLVHRLQVELRNEEMKLVLLKKVRQSQVMKENVSTTANDTKTALNKLPSNTTATKLVPSQPPPVIKQNLSAKASSSAIPAHIKMSQEYKQVKNMTSAVPSESLSPSALQAQKHLLARGTTLTSTGGGNGSGSSSSKSSNGGNGGSSSNMLSGLPPNLNLPFNLSREVEIIRKDSPASSSSPGPGPLDSPSQVSISKVRTSTPHSSHPSTDRALIKVRTSPSCRPSARPLLLHYLSLVGILFYCSGDKHFDASGDLCIFLSVGDKYFYQSFSG
ncbi:hypothetical protein E2C01_012177 [Portunus trituberculatus]|uniref:Transcriptional repressor p66 coiled-coil MBD2-interaction domain-containing protein n=1 Tax=Portunus trituberculatus TaxID=210409 RepID=A0A5B7DD08_PORTR|nr:hypothetical protein [Portunus trituberculatus]